VDKLSREGKVERLVRRDLGRIQPKLCPKCLKPLKPLSQLSGWLTPDYYYCEACGYSGAAAFEAVNEESLE